MQAVNLDLSIKKQKIPFSQIWPFLVSLSWLIIILIYRSRWILIIHYYRINRVTGYLFMDNCTLSNFLISLKFWSYFETAIKIIYNYFFNLDTTYDKSLNYDLIKRYREAKSNLKRNLRVFRVSLARVCLFKI